SRQSLQESVNAISSVDREITLSQTDLIDIGGIPAFADLAELDQKGQGLDRSMPAPLPSIVGEPIAVIETPSDRALQGTAADAEIRLRIMEDVDQHIRLVSGRAPTDHINSVPDPLHASGPAEFRDTIPQYEAEVSAPAAEKLGLKAGSQLVIGQDTQLDPLSGGSALGILVTGIYEATSADDPYWVEDAKVTSFGLREFSANITFVQSTFLVSPDLYGPLATGRENQGGSSGGLTIGAPALRLSWRFAADPSRVGPDNLTTVVAALRRLQTLYPSVAREPSDVTMTSSLLRSLAALQGPWDAAASLLVVAAIGAAAVALGSLLLVVALTAEDRRRVLLIQRERGASAPQAVAGSLVEALLVAVPAAAVGTWIAISVLPGADDGTSILIGAAVALATVALSLGVVLGAIVGPPRLPTRARAVIGSVRIRRLVFDVVIVGVALAAAAALRQRGLQPSGAAGSAASGIAVTAPAGGGTTDPLLAAAPVLVGIAAAVVAIRVAPVPLAGLAWLAARLRGLAPVLASRRAARDAGAGRVLLIVLAIATLGAFASATIVELSATAELQSWQDVGAAYRIDASRDELGGGTFFPPGLDPASLPGVTTGVSAHLGPYTLSTGGQRELVALDIAAYSRMLSSGPAALTLPPELLAPGEPASGTAAAPLPALVSSATAGPFPTGKVGSTFQLTLDSQLITFRVAAIADSFPGLPVGQPFVVASWPQIDAAAPNRLQTVTTLFVDAPPGHAAALSAGAQAAEPDAVVIDRAAEAATLGGQGVVRVVESGVLALAGIALLYAALAIVSAFVLTAASRADEAAHLATLGLSDTQSWSMLVVEFGPPVVLAVVAGAALGLGLFAFLAPGLGLTTIVGALQAAPPGLDAGQIELLGVLIAGILGLGVVLGAPAQRRAAWASVRRGLP
ncbi:MAG TPA: FtsX-like permease family protein, partial [Candidatus Limnocylindrales bacterium]|nr:FtsX-like permease family protein [Candidatus Limnocylindrales bacterium]